MTVTGLTEDGGVALETSVKRADGTRVAEGTTEVTRPDIARPFDLGGVPGLTPRRHEQFDRLLERAALLPDIPCAVVAQRSRRRWKERS